VIKRPMDLGTVVHRLKHGLYGSLRDLLLDVELFMANATRSISPPASEVLTSGRGRRLNSDGSRAAASPPPPPLLTPTILNSPRKSWRWRRFGRFPMPSADSLTRQTLWWAAAQASARRRLLAGQSGKVVTHVVIGHTLNGYLRFPVKSPHNRSSRLQKSGGGMDRNRLALNDRSKWSSTSESASLL
jgi:hypothetical protein